MHRADATIVIFGHDPLLVETRSLILRSAGFSPITAMCLESATESISTHEVDLLILCSSLSEGESRFLLMELKRLGKSKVRILALTKAELKFEAIAAKVLASPVAPETFQSVVGSLLETASDCA
jgi:DNA-binding response OmpR family regulator